MNRDNPRRKADATGRSAKIQVTGLVGKWKVEGGFVAHTRTLLESPGWRALNWPARKVLDFLEMEHLRHAGLHNGDLFAPHEQLRDVMKIHPTNVLPAIEMLVAFGIIKRTRPHTCQGGRSNAMTYALTWLPGRMLQTPPTEEFRAVTEGDVAAYLSHVAELKSAQLKRAAAITNERRSRSEMNVVHIETGVRGVH